MARPKTDPQGAGEMFRTWIAKRRGTCVLCGKPYVKGDAIALFDLRRNAHVECRADMERHAGGHLG
jgi:hypothetical protein